MNNYLDFARLLEENDISVIVDEPMSRRTSFKIGGEADVFVTAETSDDLALVLRLVKEHDVPLTILGNGSNVLVSDKGIRGVVLKLGGDFCRMEYKGGGTITAGAGVLLSHLCQFAKGNSLAGLEFAYGIPGTLGGAVYMNAGAYGGEMKDVVVECEYVTRDGEIKVEHASALDFGYRHSRFSAGTDIICSATVILQKGDESKISSAMSELMERRTSKQPLDMPSAGSVFKRPVGHFAGTLIEQCGLKGKTIGGAQVSEKHAGFIVNVGNATCEDVMNLVKFIQQTVLEQTGVALECEIRTIGEQ